MYELFLISQSPRRRELLEKAGFLFRVDTVKISEIIEENVKSADLVEKIARSKAEAYRDAHKSLKSQKIILLSADTLVFADGEPLGKPKDAADAKRILRHLSGRTHEVITGMCLVNLYLDEVITSSVTTKVLFRALSDDEIEGYIATGEPMDKAGAYGIQGGAASFVASFDGSYDNVVGLPTDKLKEILHERGWEIARAESR